MKMYRRPLLISSFALLGLVGLTACSDNSTPASVSQAPSTDATTETPTDPASSSAPTSTASKDTPATGSPSTESVTIEVDADSGVADDASVVIGTPVQIHVISETEEEFHLHGYDIELAGDDVTFEFVADKLGNFELESHDTGEVLLNLSVVAD